MKRKFNKAKFNVVCNANHAISIKFLHSSLRMFNATVTNYKKKYRSEDEEIYIKNISQNSIVIACLCFDKLQYQHVDDDMILHMPKKRANSIVENSYFSFTVDLHFKLYLRSTFVLALKELPLTNLHVSRLKRRSEKENANHVMAYFQSNVETAKFITVSYVEKCVESH